VIELNLQHLGKKQARLMTQASELLAGDGFFVAGGTGLALRFAHRDCNSIEYFSPNPFDPMAITAQLSAVKFVAEFMQSNALSGLAGDVEIICSTWPGPAPSLEDSAVGRIATLEACASSALAALTLRGTRTDYIDVYAALNDLRFSLLLQQTTAQFGLSERQVLTAVHNLRRAEATPMPNLHWRGSWPQIRRGFEAVLRKQGAWRP
jgi:hypothetical protein